MPVSVEPRYAFVPMNDEHAREISHWSYEPPYDFYSLTSDPDDLSELLDPEKRQGYYSALRDGELIGFLCFGQEARVPGGNYTDAGILDVGLGLRPDLTGKRLGLGFVLAGLAFAQEKFAPVGFRLSVATFNERAIKVYERAGFEPVETFMQRTNGGEHPFLLMARGVGEVEDHYMSNECPE
jgi:ribosomal-protein-alanine N-acetyltransferase